ncbi:DivIVA domain-containing protein [Tunicatimonas pelagia]|uniref:DivIVA domain-containing protein n=1 Tax=Tunicatimonas pelagia TaxID=931531 RepID=UPI0026659801|nr:DivIVA domain-containing protein [Tunicatimonas pelagia]WKN45981.1 DivIVA domain-containing protein [Tunicatimonas pelagia]
MKITPAEIRQKEFERNFRGYDKDEVNAFLQTMSQEWERILEDNREMRYRLDASQKEVEKLREVESSLYKTLKTAEDTGANLVEQANKTAELKIREAQLKGEEVINEAKAKAHQILEHAKARSKSIIDEMGQRLQELKQRHQAAENQYDDLVFQLENAAQKALQTAERASERRTSGDKSSGPEASAIKEEYYAFISQQTSEFERKISEIPSPALKSEPTEESISSMSSPSVEEEPESEIAAEPEPITQLPVVDASAPQEESEEEERIEEEPEPVSQPVSTARSTKKSFFDEID